MLFAHNLLLGFAKPGARKEPNFLKTTIARFTELLSIAEENECPLILTGKAIANMRLEHWLDILNKIADFNVKIWVIANTKPSDDLVALHNSGHLALLSHGNKRPFNQRGEMSFNGNVVTFMFDGEVFTYNTHLNTLDTNGDSIMLPNVIQVDQHVAAAVIIKKEIGQSFSLAKTEFDDESHMVLMDYVEAIQVNASTVSDSKFIQALQRSEESSGQLTIHDAIARLEAPADISDYLVNLAFKAESFDEFREEA